MNTCYMLEMIDYIIDFMDLLEIALDEWDAGKVLIELIHFRRYGRLTGDYIGSQARPVFLMLLHELKAQIAKADDEWFEAWKNRQEDREMEARATDAEPEAQARAEEDAEAAHA